MTALTDSLPPSRRRELAAAGFDQEYFEAATPAVALTVVALGSRLSRLGLWSFVATDESTGVGVLEFRATDVSGLKAALRDRADFSNPGRSPRRWSSRQRVLRYSLHFKHFPHWSPEVVQVHVDPWGLPPASELFRAPLTSIATTIGHLGDPEGYLEVGAIWEATRR